MTRRWVVAMLGRVAVVLLAFSSPIGAAGQTEGASSEYSAPEAATPKAPKVDLGRLLRLPDSYQQPAESRRGLTKAVWAGRFELVRLNLYSSQLALEKAQTELGETAGESGQWSVAAPGTNPNPENTPLSYKLRQEIRRQRESIERAERDLRSLEIEADLAEVPIAWRATEVGQSPAGSARIPSGLDRVGRQVDP